MKIRLAVLTVSSYVEIGGFNAEHWYGKIHCIDEDRKSFELKRKLTDQKEADHLNEKDETSEFSEWKIGSETNRFKSREDVQNEAVRQWKDAFPGHDALVGGLTAIADPQLPLDARKPEILKMLNCFWNAACATGGYEEDARAMHGITDEYSAWVDGKSGKKQKRSRAARREGPRAPVKGP